MSLNVLRINTDLECEVVDISEGDVLKNMQAIVGGLVEVAYLDEDCSMWLNEEGKLDHLPVNMVATVLWKFAYSGEDFIVGDVFLTGPSDEEGYAMSLAFDKVEKYKRLISHLKDLMMGDADD